MSCPTVTGMPVDRSLFRCRGVRHTRWLSLFVFLLLRLTGAWSQPEVIRTDLCDSPAPSGLNSDDTVAVARSRDNRELSEVDATRYVRVSTATNTMAFNESTTIDSVAIIVYFHVNTDERVSVVSSTGDLVISSKEFQGQLKTVGPCLNSSITSRSDKEVCSATSNWFRVTWKPIIPDCSPRVAFQLEGAETETPVNVGEIVFFGPSSSCEDDSSSVSTVVIIAAAVGALLLLLVVGYCCWRCLRPQKQGGSYDAQWAVPGEVINPINHQMQGNDPFPQTAPENMPPRGLPGTYSNHTNAMASPQMYVSSAHEYRAPPSQPPINAMSNGGVKRSEMYKEVAIESESTNQGSTATQNPIPSHPMMSSRSSSAAKSGIPEAVKYSASTVATSNAPSSEPKKQAPIHTPQPAPAHKPPPVQNPTSHAPHKQPAQKAVPQNPPQQVESSDDEDDGKGPAFEETHEEPPDRQQDNMLKDIHLQQAAGITEMIQGVENNLRQMQTLQGRKPENDVGLEILNKIGGGGFGEVFKGRYKGKDVAVKIMKIKPGARQASLTELPYTEAAIAGICIHANIVQTMYSDLMPVLDTSTPEGGGSFWSRGRDDRPPSRALNRSDSSVKEWQDPRGFIAKLSDFGLSMKMAAHDGQVPGIKYGTVQYLAPEVLNTHIMTKKADVYSFGVIMWEVWHSRLFAEFYNNEKRKRRATGQSMDDYRPMVSSKCPKSFVHLMTQCLDKNPDRRPDFLGGKVNIVIELERLINEEYQKMNSSSR